MAAQRTENEEAEFNLPLPSPTTSAASPPRRFSTRSAASPARLPIRTDDVEPPPEAPALERREVNRCSGCRRKVGLTGFRCRCGELFCSEHRYSDRHVCGFDYKAAGREAIARENPLVKATKIIRI